MLIDGHAHACGAYLTVESITRELQNNHTDKVVLTAGGLDSSRTFHFPNLVNLTPDLNVLQYCNGLIGAGLRVFGIGKQVEAGNEYVFELKRQLPDQVLQFFWIPWVSENMTEYLDRHYHLYHFDGLKIHQCWTTVDVDSDFFRDVANWADTHHKPLFVHLRSEKEVMKLVRLKQKYPGLKLIIAHLFGLEILISENIRQKDLYFDISPLEATSDRRVLHAIAFYGAKRVLFGSDTPYGGNNLQNNIARVRRLPITPGDKELILGDNMQRILDEDGNSQ